MEPRFQEPGWFTKHVFNPLVAVLTRLGRQRRRLAGARSARGARAASGGGRRSTSLAFEGDRYLVAPRGHTQWVRNMRVSGGGRLVLGRRVEEFTRDRARRRGEAAPAARLPEEVEMGGRRSSSAASAPTLREEELRASPPTTRSSGIELEGALVPAARRARKKITPQLTAMIPISRRTIASAIDCWSSAGSASKSMSPISRWAAPARAPSAMKRDDQRQDPVEVVEVVGGPRGR